MHLMPLDGIGNALSANFEPAVGNLAIHAIRFTSLALSRLLRGPVNFGFEPSNLNFAAEGLAGTTMLSRVASTQCESL